MKPTMLHLCSLQALWHSVVFNKMYSTRTPPSKSLQQSFHSLLRDSTGNACADRFIPRLINLTIIQLCLCLCIYIHHITSHHISSHHIISYHIISYHIILYYIILYYIISSYIIPYYDI